jgi:hypothetical protein
MILKRFFTLNLISLIIRSIKYRLKIVSLTWLAVLISGCTSLPLNSSSLVQNSLLTVEASQSSVVAPTGWRIDGEPETMALDPNMIRNGRPLLRVTFKSGKPYAGFVQQLQGNAWRGKRVTVNTKLARNNGEMPTGVWIRAFDKNKESIMYANTYDEPLPADSKLNHQQLVFDIPADAESVLVGASVYGDVDGAAWFQSLDVVLGEVLRETK